MTSKTVEVLAAEAEIRDVLHRFSRGIDRCDWELIRSCFHPDGTDHHGDFYGGVDDFVAFASAGVARYRSSQHMIANILIDVRGDEARSEAYCVSRARLAASQDLPERDVTMIFRYLDDLERRDGEWRILRRVCVYDSTRTDLVGDGWPLPDGFRRGARDREDISYLPVLPTPSVVPVSRPRVQ